MRDFVHLHVHTKHSFFDGMASVRDLYEAARKNGMPGFAVTDHGNMCAMPELFALAKEYPDIKPIAGCEIYLTDHYDIRLREENDHRCFHLILLAKNESGYRNLCRIVSESNGERDQGRRAFVSHDMVEKYHEGLICTSACLGGEVAQAILEDDLDKARTAIRWYKKVFGDDFYLELDIHKNDVESRIYPKQKIVAKWIPILGHELKVKVIAANDVHYVNEWEADAHDKMLIRNTNSDPKDPDRFRYTGQEWFKTQEQMEIAFMSSNEQYVWNTMEVFHKIEDYRNIRPYTIDGVEDADKRLRELVYDGYGKLYGGSIPAVEKVVECELDYIKTIGAAEYYLWLLDVQEESYKHLSDFHVSDKRVQASEVMYLLGLIEKSPYHSGNKLETPFDPYWSVSPALMVEMTAGALLQKFHSTNGIFTLYGRRRTHGAYYSDMAASILMEAWKNRDNILGNESLYNQQLDWVPSGGSFCGDLPMPIGLILECWLDNGPFILPDGRKIFQFQGGLSGACGGSAIDMGTGKISPFWSKQGNNLSFPLLWKKRSKIWKRHKERLKEH